MTAVLFHCNVRLFSDCHHYLTFLISYLQFLGGYTYNSDVILKGVFPTMSVREMMTPG